MKKPRSVAGRGAFEDVKASAPTMGGVGRGGEIVMGHRARQKARQARKGEDQGEKAEDPTGQSGNVLDVLKGLLGNLHERSLLLPSSLFSDDLSGTGTGWL
ncbi:hypothetical protein [Gluconobacter cerinus]|uniref:hypothetical protein n=1 Tax=Gluconobacter cerinus TaxID=38307 RepID=UPI00201161C7|nr:hypothetical protein [Gluconobacter cerinus]